MCKLSILQFFGGMVKIQANRSLRLVPVEERRKASFSQGNSMPGESWPFWLEFL